MKILIVKLSAIGDVVMALPFLEALRKAYPQAHMAWLVEEAAADLVRDHPLLDQVLVSRRKTWVRWAKAGRLARTWEYIRPFLRELRAGPWDMVIDLQGLFKSGILTFFSGGRRRIGFDRTRELSYLALNERLAPYDPDRHALLRYLDVARYLGAPEEQPVFRLPEDQAAAGEAGFLLSGSQPLRVAVNPGAKWPSKLWPAAHWRELLGRLASRPDLTVVLTGGEEDEASNAAMGNDHLIDLTGMTNLKTLAEIYRRCHLLICPDTGPMHLAAAVGTRVLALFGPTAPGRTGPFGRNHVILRTNLACSPCFRKDCPHPRCLQELTPNQVLSAAEEVLTQSEI